MEAVGVTPVNIAYSGNPVMPNMSRPAQVLIDLIAKDLVIGEVWHVRDGGVVPLDLPGQGVEADWNAIERCHETYLAQGQVQAFTPSPGDY
jgi:hypothetical protein